MTEPNRRRRYYYTAFHYARAALLTRGLEPKTHAGVAGQFSAAFVRTGALPARDSRVLSRLQREREQADYAREALFGLEDAQEARQAVLDFRARLRELLTSEGWLV